MLEHNTLTALLREAGYCDLADRISRETNERIAKAAGLVAGRAYDVDEQGRITEYKGSGGPTQLAHRGTSDDRDKSE